VTSLICIQNQQSIKINGVFNMRRSNRHKSLDPNHGRELIDPSLKSLVEKHFKGQVLPRGFYENPSDDSIKLWLFDHELCDWIMEQTGWTKARTEYLLTRLCKQVIEDKLSNYDIYDTLRESKTIGFNGGTWTICVWIPLERLDAAVRSRFLMCKGLSKRDADIVAPDWHKTAFDF